ncbi:hypothetical protein [Chitinimonas koreensis]|uniref:hypothetical protein n=1 Tax=Chitinimonas koreensis TaxID=356302 RepID=UPI0003F9C5D5|nr:hypothetical protein [Chitinimonas koreensis]QNM95600.1 hypothetical protein H9L41_17310 [Chitinimonas koreensis]
MEPTPRLKVSFRLFALNLLGSVMAAFGMLGVGGNGAAIHPLLALPAVSAGLLCAGLALMAWFMFDLFKRIRAQRGQDQQDNR